MDNFLKDVLQGLAGKPKTLLSKYFYDDAGDALFQQIMKCDAYYPTNCEQEILSMQTEALARTLTDGFYAFDLLELGAGDASKTSFLLKALIRQEARFTYMPIDISAGITDYLDTRLPELIPGLNVKALNGEYFEMVEEARKISAQQKVVLFLGGNIGNMQPHEALDFCRKLRASLQFGDLILLGFDLKKNPYTIRNAYDDPEGLTKAFNINLLKRINKELSGNFDVSQFEHYASYDPSTGACKSYLFSVKDQEVLVAGNTFHFEKDEYIFMEISQKYTTEQVDLMAENSGFETVQHFYDSKHWYLDTVWKVI